MSSPPTDFRAMAQAGVLALRAGRDREAQMHFQRVVSAGRGDASVYTGLAIALFRLGLLDAANTAIDGALRMDPRSLRAMILKADIVLASGDPRAATAFFQAVVDEAGRQPSVPEDLASEVERARQHCERTAGDFEAFLRNHLGPGAPSSGTSSRFTESIDVLFGHKKLFPQEPRYYHVPGLPATPFHDLARFDWIPALEQATEVIRSELREVMGDPANFLPYVAGDPSRPQKEQAGMVNNADWGAFYLWKGGQLVGENAARCPKTVEAMQKVPLVNMPGRSPSVLFSLLKPGAHIPPHCGLVNTRLICHLPLIVPGNCHFRVGNDVREWQEGKVWVFDDSIEHEAWNRSDQTRVILLFEVWTPEIQPEERNLILQLFEGIDRYSRKPPNWEI